MPACDPILSRRRLLALALALAVATPAWADGDSEGGAQGGDGGGNANAAGSEGRGHGPASGAEHDHGEAVGGSDGDGDGDGDGENDTDRDADGDLDDVQDAVGRGEIRSLGPVREAVSREFGGEIIGIDIERRKSRWVYEFKIVDAGGRLLEVEVDARTARVVKVRNR